MSEEKRPTTSDRDEPVKTDLDPQTAPEGSLQLQPHSQFLEDREHKLDWIRKSSEDELADPKIRDGLIAEAREAGATEDEIDTALRTRA